MTNTRVYKIENANGDHNEMHKIRAISAAEAKRICKKLFGGLVKNMTVCTVYGHSFEAEND